MRVARPAAVAIMLSVFLSRAALASPSSEIEARIDGVPFVNYLFPSLVVFLAGLLMALMMLQRARR